MLPDQRYEQLIRKVTRFTLGFMMVWGLVIVLAQVRPFWVDEWRVIYNLKYKSFTSIFGSLDYMQQFPRVYLWLIKCFSYPFDYSYFTLRLPSYLIGVAVILVCYRLMNRLYTKHDTSRFLFVMILVSSFTFTEYFVQIKQYTMDILLSLLAIYQLLELLSLSDGDKWNRRRYIWLCVSFAVLPFFSYTYPLAVCPLYLLLLIRSIALRKKMDSITYHRMLLRMWLPLLLCACSIVVFYFADVRQVMADNGMKQFWGHRLMKSGFSYQSFFVCSYELFSKTGSGALFEILFGVTGIAAFCFGIYRCIYYLGRRDTGKEALVTGYCILLLLIMMLLFATGKFPLGETRLDAFAVPAISILIIALLKGLKACLPAWKLSEALVVIFFVGVTGNIYTTFFASFTGSSFNKKLSIYEHTEDAIILAQDQSLPIFITPDIAYPYDRTTNYPFAGPIPGDWVLKAFPAYKIYKHIPVFAVNSITEAKSKLLQMPSCVTAAIAGDGHSFQIVSR